MKTKYLIIIVLILTAAAAWSLVRTGCFKNSSPETVSAEVYPVISPDKVTEFQFSYGGKKTTLKRQDGRWLVSTSQDALASGAAVSEFLTAFAKTRPVREIEMPDEKVLKEMNLSTDPSLTPGKGCGVRLCIVPEDGKESVIWFGLAHVRKDDGASRLAENAGTTYDGRFVRVNDNAGQAHVYLLPRVFDNCLPDARLWLEPFRMVLDSGIESLQFREKDQVKWMVFRNQKAKGYILVPSDAGILSLKTLADRMELLSNPFSGDIYQGDAAKLDFQYSLNVVCRNGLRYRLQLSRIPEQQILAGKLEVKVDPERLPRKPGESDENYTTRKNKFMQEAENLNRAFQNRIYTVRPDLIDRLSPVPVENKK